MLGLSEYFTPSELSEYLGVNEKTLANWRGMGKGPTFERFGNRIRYFRDQVEVWRSKNRHASTQEYKQSEPPVVKPSKVSTRAGIVDQIIALVRQLDALDQQVDDQVDRPAMVPPKRPRGRPRKFR